MQDLFERCLLSPLPTGPQRAGNANRGANEPGMDTPIKPILPPYLMSVRRIKQCSVCGAEFPKDAKPSLSRAFGKHVEEVHRGPQEEARRNDSKDGTGGNAIAPYP
jgi:hypothetical protein